MFTYVTVCISKYALAKYILYRSYHIISHCRLDYNSSAIWKKHISTLLRLLIYVQINVNKPPPEE